MVHMKYNSKWWHHLFYADRGTYSTEFQYWDTVVIWLFKWVVFEKTIEWGTKNKDKLTIKWRSKSYNFFNKIPFEKI